MAYTSVVTKKPSHAAVLMEMTTNQTMTFTATCPVCGFSQVLTIAQAAAGQARCFGNIITLSWPKD